MKIRIEDTNGNELCSFQVEDFGSGSKPCFPFNGCSPKGTDVELTPLDEIVIHRVQVNNKA